jgi:hypothetical protein
MTILSLTKDNKGFNAYGRVPAELQYNATLTSVAGEQTIAIPNNMTRVLVIFSYAPGAIVWVAINNTAAAPTGASFASTTSEINPVAYELKANDVIHVLTPDTASSVGVAIYALQ